MADCQALKILPDLAIEKLAIPLRFALMGLARGCGASIFHFSI
ncbi:MULTISPECIES: hypothetical protein [unclassified Microcoleus]|nr:MULTISPECIES: hypothetical protein [unclassified Microcoleus]